MSTTTRTDGEYQRDLATQREDDAAAMASCAVCLLMTPPSRALHIAGHPKEQPQGAPQKGRP
jgi:hypothetical protein